MGKLIRTLIAIVIILSFVLVARNQVAWAATADSSNESTQPALSASSDRDRDDDECKKKDHKKSKSKDKDKDRDKDDDDDECDDDNGTVVPPGDKVEICKKGSYSIGGVATAEVKRLKDRKHKEDCFKASTQSSSGIKLPKKAGPVLSSVIKLTSVGKGSNIKLCFAVPPGKKVKIYSSGEKSWRSAGTSVKNGIACTQVTGSGSFVLVQK